MQNHAQGSVVDMARAIQMAFVCAKVGGLELTALQVEHAFILHGGKAVDG